MKMESSINQTFSMASHWDSKSTLSHHIAFKIKQSACKAHKKIPRRALLRS